MTSYEYQKFYSIFLNVSQKALLKSGEELSPIIWYKNIFRTYSLSKEIMNNLETEDIAYVYNDLYLNRSFVFDPEKDLLKDYNSHLLVFVLFIILIILFYSILVNLFLVQESKSIIEYSNLKSVGATNKDISKIIRLKIIYIPDSNSVRNIFISWISKGIIFNYKWSRKILFRCKRYIFNIYAFGFKI